MARQKARAWLVYLIEMDGELEHCGYALVKATTEQRAWQLARREAFEWRGPSTPAPEFGPHACESAAGTIVRVDSVTPIDSLSAFARQFVGFEKVERTLAALPWE